MAVTRVEEVAAKRKQSVNFPNDKTTTRVYYVWCDSRDDDESVAFAGTGIPTIGSLYSDNYSVCKKLDCQCMSMIEDSNDKLLYEVTATYEFGRDEDEEEGQEEENPLNRPPRRIPSYVIVPRIVTKDRTGATIVVSNGKPPVDPIQDDDIHPVMTIIRNEPVFNYQQAWEFIGAVNKNAIWGAEARTIICRDYSSPGLIREGQYYYWEVTYVLEYKKDKWDVELLNQGFTDAAGTTLKDSFGQRLQTPALLDTNGDVTLTPSYTDPWRYKTELDFAELGDLL